MQDYDVIYKSGDEAYLQIQSMDDGINYDFSFFCQDDFKLIDGGFTDFNDDDDLASATILELATAIAEDFKMKTDNISIADESVIESIEKANYF